MENKQTLEEKTFYPAQIVFYRDVHLSDKARGDRTLGLFEIDGETEVKLDTSRKIMEYIFNTGSISRASVYQGINEDSLHQIAKTLAKAEDYGDAAQIVNSAFLKEYANK